MSDTHEAFLAALSESDETVGLVAMWLAGRGYMVRKPTLHFAPTHEDRRKYADHGDLIVTVERRVEVKRRSLDFTCAEDFPFPDIAVVRALTWDRADPKPWFFVNVNRAGTHAAIVQGKTFDQWSVREMIDKRYGPDYGGPTYYCPIRLVTFTALE